MAGKKTVVIIDSSGRGAALAHKYSMSPHVGKIVGIPGNDLMSLYTTKPVKTYQNLKTTDVSKILDICKGEEADLVDVAQDDAIAAGVADKLLDNGFKVVGPTKLAGQIEWDKSWARYFMGKFDIPSPRFYVFHSAKDGRAFLKTTKDRSWFVKASGLALGKGALPAENNKEAAQKISELKEFGKASETYLLEEWLRGEEFSMFALTDGRTYQIIGNAQDHKRLHDGDLGPNTGGVGCSTPPLIVDKSIYKQAEDIIRKTINGLKKEGRPYKGILYLGAIVVKGKVFVIEFNARWGSPEAEVLVQGIQNDMFDIGISITNESLNKTKIKTDGKARVVVTGSLRPGIESKKRELFGLDDVLKLPGVTVYGTRVNKVGKKYFVSSGRLFHVVGEGKTVIEARKKAYEAMSLLFIEGNNLHFRTDIGWRDVARLTKNIV